jgi:hypothetical protein
MPRWSTTIQRLSVQLRRRKDLPPAELAACSTPCCEFRNNSTFGIQFHPSQSQPPTLWLEIRLRPSVVYSPRTNYGMACCCSSKPIYPEFDSLHDEPAYRDLLAPMNLSGAGYEAGYKVGVSGFLAPCAQASRPRSATRDLDHCSLGNPTLLTSSANRRSERRGSSWN